MHGHMFASCTNREISEHISRNFDKKDVLPSFFLEGFRCHQKDVHLIEAADEGILIPPMAAGFSKVSPDILAVSDEDGSLILYNTNKRGYNSFVHEFIAHKNAVFDLDWMEGEGKLLTASGDQTSVLWDVETEDKLATFRGHTSSIKSVRWRPDDCNLFASGARDGHIMVFDCRTKPKKDGSTHAVNVIRNAHLLPDSSSQSVHKTRRRSVHSVSQDRQSVTSVLFQDEYALVSSGSCDGIVKVWDLRKVYSNLKDKVPVPVHELRHPDMDKRAYGYSHLMLDYTRTRLFASCMNNQIYQFSMATYQKDPVSCYQGHKMNSSFYVRTALSFDDTFLLSGSSDGNAYIWKVNHPCEPPAVLSGHQREVSNVCWAPNDLFKLVTAGDDCSVRIWRHQHVISEDNPSEWPGRTIVPLTRQDTELPDKSSHMNCSSYFKTDLKKANSWPVTRPRLTRKCSCGLKITNDNQQECKKKQKILSKSEKSSNIMDFLRKPPSNNNLLLSPSKKPRHLVLKPMEKSPVPGSLGIASKLIYCKNSEKKVFICAKEDLKCDKITTARLTRKRKLSDCDASNSAKKICRSTSAIFDSENTENANSPSKVAKSPLGNKILKEIIPSNETKKKLFDSTDINENCSVIKTPSKSHLPKCENIVNFVSPTSNLPNSVMDPQPRTPRSHQEKQTTPKSVDWLTRVRLRRTASTPSPSCSPNSSSKASPKTPSDSVTPLKRHGSTGTPVRKSMSTPSPSQDPVARKKITQYFSRQ